MQPFFGKTNSPSATIFGAPEAFSFEKWLEEASQIRIAVAFGHMSGWRRLESAITGSKADHIEILLGQAFFQTEPKLLFELKHLQSADERLSVRLASAVTTFHPKLWLVTSGGYSQAIVGSSNLSSGGFSANIECNLYTAGQSVAQELLGWFADQWSIAHGLDSEFFQTYVAEHDKINQQRVFLQIKVEQSQDTLASLEAKWRRKEALHKACAYWKTEEGLQSARHNEKAISEMRTILHFPGFEFTGANYSEFVRLLEFGRIRLAYVEQTIAALPQLKAALKGIGRTTTSSSYNRLDEVYGLGPNLTSKLLAVFDPQQFIVVNGPVERALLSFGFSQEDLDPMSGVKYERFLKELHPFIEEAGAQNLLPAAALDAFFYFYRGTP
jgi:PLD-like domain